MVAHTNQRSEHQRRGFQQVLQRPKEMLGEYPFSSMLVVFGLGLGVGLVVAQALCSTSMFEPEPTMTERWQRNLMHAADRVLPSSMSRQLHQYTT